MFFENAADDGEAKAGAFLARRHIRLEQPVAVLLRQAGAVVDDVDHDIPALALDRNIDAAAPQFLRRYRSDRLRGVLHDVGQSLRDQAAVELRRHVLALGLDLYVEIRIADALQEYDLPRRVGDILAGHHRLRHAREAR